MQQGQQGQRPRVPVIRDGGADGPARGASHAGPAGAAVLTLDSWDRMMVSALPAAPAAAGGLPPGLARALALIDAGFAAVDPAKEGGARAVPSAGAIHPYECYVVAGDEPAVYATDAVRRRVFPRAAGERVPRLLARAGVAAPPAGGALLVVVTRPWLSMRKYGDRGYLYTHLDTAHLAVNLLGLAAEEPDSAADLRLRLGREPLAGLLGVAADCREIHSVLRVGPGRGPAPGWTVYEAGPAGPARGADDLSWLERVCWQSLRPVVDEAVTPLPASAPHLASLLPPGPRPPVEGAAHLAGRWRGLSGIRRSAKAFRPAPVAAGALGRALAAIRTPLTTDLPTHGDLHVTLLARTVDGLAPGTYRLTGEEPAALPPAGDRPIDGGGPRPQAIDTGPPTGELRPAAAPGGGHASQAQDGIAAGELARAGDAGSGGPSDADLVRACMHQDHLGGAAAVVLFHIRRDALLGRPPAAMREALFRAGALGQLLYLGATDAGIGVTGVGGFDTRRWQRLGCVPDDHELLYLVLLGADTGPGVKWDRLQAAYAQGER